MPSPLDTNKIQADALALTVATHHMNIDGINAVLGEYMTGVPPVAATKIASLLTMQAKLLAESLELIATNEGVDFDTIAQIAGRLGAERAGN